MLDNHTSLTRRVLGQPNYEREGRREGRKEGEKEGGREGKKEWVVPEDHHVKVALTFTITHA